MVTLPLSYFHTQIEKVADFCTIILAPVSFGEAFIRNGGGGQAWGGA